MITRKYSIPVETTNASDLAEVLAAYYFARLFPLRTESARWNVIDSLDDFSFPDALAMAELPANLKLPALLRRVQAAAKKIEPAAMRAETLLRQRLDGLADSLSLQAAEVSLLLFCSLATLDAPLHQLCGQVKTRSAGRAGRFLSRVLDVDARFVATALGSTSRLRQQGLLADDDFPTELDDWVKVPSFMSYGLAAAEPFENYVLGRAFREIDTAAPESEDFSHLATDRKLLAAALTGVAGPAHVLLVGPPGVGKTWLARRVAADLGRKLLEVRVEDDDGDPSYRAGRFGHYGLGCRLIADGNAAVVLFDEAEDVFVGDHWMHVAPSKERHKGWTNRLLEEVRVPTIWISNSVDAIDPAYLRRFNYVLQMETPPRSVRRRMLGRAVVPGTVDDAQLNRIADSEAFTPADAGRIQRMLPAAVAAGVPAEEALRRLALCRPNGISRSEIAPRRNAGLPFKLEWINVDADLPALIEGLRRRGSGTLLFSGPPGTGKTELGHHIATALDKPLQARKASDLLSPYVGESEKLIAQAFERAADEDAVLLIDEADSFLTDRRQAQRSWEVTQVNEMLAQLDGYRGVAILTTNHADTLDAALMRRMDVKLQFGWLDAEPLIEAFSTALASRTHSADTPTLTPTLLARLRRTRGACAGHLVTALRRMEAAGQGCDAENLLAALENEIRLCSPDRGRKIGF